MLIRNPILSRIASKLGITASKRLIMSFKE